MPYKPQIPGLDATGSGGSSVDLTAPGPIGGTTPSTGAFSSVQVGGGATVTKVLVGSLFISPGTLGALVFASIEVTVTGAAVSDYAVASFDGDLSGVPVVIVDCIAGSDKVTVRFVNLDAGNTQNYPGGTVRVIVFKAS